MSLDKTQCFSVLFRASGKMLPSDWRSLEAARQHQARLTGTHIYRVSWVCDHQQRTPTYLGYVHKPKPHQIFSFRQRGLSA